MTIVDAVEAGDLAALRARIAAGGDVNARSEAGQSALHIAASRGDIDAARALLDAGAVVDARSRAAPRLARPTVADLSTREGAEALAGLFGEVQEESEPAASGVSGHTPLADAAVGGHVEVLRLLLDRGADVDARDGEGYTALGFAVVAGHREAMELLIARGADLEAKTRDGLTPLMLAALDGRLGIVRTLLDLGADPNAESEAAGLTLTPLGLAVQRRHHAVADAMNAAGAMGARTPLETGAALARAVSKDRVDLVQSLIAAGADVNASAGGGDHLHAAAEHGSVEMMRVLIQAGAKLEARKSFWGTTPLMVAAEHGREEAVAALLGAGANVHAPIVQDEAIFSDHRNGSTALLLAARAGHSGVVRLLLAAGADRNAVDAEGRTAAERAAEAGHDAVVALLTEVLTPAQRDARLAGAAAAGDSARVAQLLRTGANPEAAGRRPGDYLSRPALCLAASGGHLDAVRALLAGGASVDARIALDGRCASMLAAEEGHAEVVRMLLDAGADPNARVAPDGPFGGMTPLILAAKAGCIAAARVLLDAGASVHVKDALSFWDRERGPAGLTALGYAVRADEPDPELVSLLLDAGAYPDARDEDGGTPLILAAYVGRTEVVRRLLAGGADARSPARDERDQTALEAAAMCDDATTYQVLRDAGAEPAATGGPVSALQLAIFRGATEMIDRMLDDGFDVNAESSDGATPLSTAAMMGRLEVARRLLDLGADPDGGASRVDHPLHRAAVMGHAEMVRALLDAGADPDARNPGGVTPLLDLAREGGRMPIGNPSGLLDCARTLLDAGADVDALADGRSALAIASERGFEGLVRLLREREK